jgi:ATP-dependent Clp protease adaptor protein ClpS
MSETTTLPRPKEKRDRKLKRQPPYNVILLNDDDHTVEYVVHMMQSLFGHPVEKGLQIASEVHFQGRCIIYTCTRELAELKQEQIHAFGPDKLIDHCQGSMSADIEAAE